MMNEKVSMQREGFCPVYDIGCPAGSDAAQSCEARFSADYNPLTSFRDADIEHCAIYRKEQLEQNPPLDHSANEEKTKFQEDGE